MQKKRKDAMRKDDKIKVSNGVFLHGVFFVFLRRNFVFSHGVIYPFIYLHGTFRLFVFSHGVFSSLHLFAWRLFVAERRQDKMAQSSHHIVHYLMVCLPTSSFVVVVVTALITMFPGGSEERIPPLLNTPRHTKYDEGYIDFFQYPCISLSFRPSRS